MPRNVQGGGGVRHGKLEAVAAKALVAAIVMRGQVFQGFVEHTMQAPTVSDAARVDDIAREDGDVLGHGLIPWPSHPQYSHKTLFFHFITNQGYILAL